MRGKEGSIFQRMRLEEEERGREKEREERKGEEKRKSMKVNVTGGGRMTLIRIR